MKKIILALTLALAAVCLFCVTASASLDLTEAEARALDSVSDLLVCDSAGDCNLDGGVSVDDAREALRTVIGLENMEELQIERADINNDGRLSIEDARLILRIAIGVDEQCGHDTEELVIVPATCVTEGYSIRYCKMCLKKYSETTGLDPENHSILRGWVTVKEATCQTEGFKEYRCFGCNAVIKDKVTEKTGHKYDAWVYPDGKDCMNPVNRYRVCQYCGYRQDDVLNPRGAHEYFWVHTVKATCTEDGLDEYKCAYCDAVSESKVVKAKGHLYNTINTVEYKKATCTEDGLAANLCVNCGLPKEGTVTVVPATGHSFDLERYKVTKEPTCYEEGTADVTCTVCGAVEEIALDKTEHTYLREWETVKPATCTEDGEKTAECKFCGELSETIPATGHTGEWTVTKKATCSEEGEKTFVCTVCGEKTTEVIEKTAHKWSKKATEKGYDTITLMPTCSAKGKAVKTCTVCGYEQEVTLKIKPDAHEASGETVLVTPATCTQDEVRGTVCKYCGETLKTTKVAGTATGHTAGETVVTKQPTCTEPGEQTVYCSVCGEAIETTSTAPAGHSDPVTTVTYGTDGKGTRTVTCGVCGEVIEEVEFSKFVVSGNGTVTFEAGSVFEAGQTVRFTVESDTAIAEIKVFFEGADETGVTLTAEGGVYVFDIPATLAEEEVITIRIYSELG